MSNLKKWKKIQGNSSFMKWTEPGQEIEGEWKGYHDGKFGPNGTVHTQNGNMTFPLHTGLYNQVEDIPEGVEIKIVYLGKQVNPNTQREFKAFDVFVNEEQEVK